MDPPVINLFKKERINIFEIVLGEIRVESGTGNSIVLHKVLCVVEQDGERCYI